MKKITFLFGFLFLGIFTAQSQFTDLLDFTSTNGSSPYSDLTFSHNKDTLFGMTETGGANGVGCIFSILPDGTGYTDLLDFNTTTGANPYGALTLAGNMLYGMTEAGGAYNMGCVFSIQTNGSGYTDIMDFNGENGAFPYGSLVLSYTGDSLIGMTSGGDNSYGTIFSMNTNGTNFTVLHEFDDTDGAAPYGSLTLAHTTYRLYGMTSSGGTSSYGDIFTIHTDGSGFTDLFNFNNENGAAPISSLVSSVSGDTLYGFTSQGGTGNGVIFSLVDGDVFTDLYTFNGTDGYSPEGDMTLANGILYGMTPQGGYGGGNVFSIYPDGSNYTNLLNFNSTNGAYPYGSLLFLNNTLYGMTSQGGTDNDGLIFSFNMLAVDSFQVTGVTCADSYLGSATAYPAGGTSPYTYSWSDGGTNQTESGLTVGTYTVTVTDSLGSTATSTTIVNSLSIGVSSITNISCNGGSNGSITVSASGGTGSYVYSWIGLPPGILPVFAGGGSFSLNPKGESPTQDGLPAGTYTITVRDWCGDSVFVLGTVTQPDLMAVSTTSSLSNICAGTSTTLTTGTSGGTAPYTYAWSPSTYLSCSDCQNPVAMPPHSIIDTVTVTDNNGCTNFTIDTIAVHSLPTAPGITALNADSTKFVVSKPDSMLSYAWRATDSEGDTLTGTAPDDTINLFYYLRECTLTVSATHIATGCTVSTVISIIHPIISNYIAPANLPYPRWSKRGMELAFADYYIGASTVSQDSIIQYTKRNDITYVLLEGLEDVVFGDTTHYLDTMQARLLENFIILLKDSGGVQEIGVACIDNNTIHKDSLAWNSYLYDINFMVKSVNYFNWDLAAKYKIDVLSMDQEFEYGSRSVANFHAVHMPILRDLYAAAHECPNGFLKVEDYLEFPTNPNNSGFFDPWDSIEVMEEDSIAMYSNRILLSNYTNDPGILYNQANYILPYPVFGSDSIMGIDSIRKTIELWPSFDPANAITDSCAYCVDYYGPGDFLGDPMCMENKTPDYMEEQYYDSLAYSEKIRKFTDVGNTYSQFDMGGDTNFTIGGCFWFQYHCLSHVRDFDTGATSALKFYVSLGPNIQWYYPSGLIPPQPVTLRAKAHGGTPPFNYIWYNDSDNAVLQSSSTDTLVVHFLYPSYPKRISVLAVDAHTLTATDYINFYQICNPPPLEKPVKPNSGTSQIDSIAALFPIKIYPNPNDGNFTLEYNLPQGETGRLLLFNELGEKAGEYLLETNTTKMNISNNSLANGVYIYQLWINNKAMKRGKLIIIK